MNETDLLRISINVLSKVLQKTLTAQPPSLATIMALDESVLKFLPLSDTTRPMYRSEMAGSGAANMMTLFRASNMREVRE
jgi:hypothetical protein